MPRECRCTGPVSVTYMCVIHKPTYFFFCISYDLPLKELDFYRFYEVACAAVFTDLTFVQETSPDNLTKIVVRVLDMILL